MEGQPLDELKRLEGFVEVARGGATRVLYDDCTGLTLLAHAGKGNDRELWRGRPGIAVLYEYEDEQGRPVQQTVIETDRARVVCRLRRLVLTHAQRIRASGLKASQGAFDAPARCALRMALDELSDTPQDRALPGFINAVLFSVDDPARCPPLRAPVQTRRS